MTKEELEKEAAEFEESNTVYQAAKREDGTDYAKKVCKVTIKEAYLAAAEPREKRIAELKESGSVICDRLSERIDETVELKNENIGLKNQLTKAKELLKRCYDNYIYLEPLRNDIEQFLNSEVEK